VLLVHFFFGKMDYAMLTLTALRKALTLHFIIFWTPLRQAQMQAFATWGNSAIATSQKLLPNATLALIFFACTYVCLRWCSVLGRSLNTGCETEIIEHQDSER